MVSDVAGTQFSADLERVGRTSARLRLPVDLEEVFGRTRPPREISFDELSFTHRREFVEWVEEAQRPKTRTRCIARTVENVRAGRHR
jgi:uncharacterized protein YdeI (YjbR/CyaY-like superfamily)